MKNFEYVYKNKIFSKIEFDEDLTLSNGEVLISPKNIGICGSDLFSMEVVDDRSELRLGHEWVGEVIESKSPSFNKGDFVTTPAILGCGKCQYCLQNKENNCLDAKIIGGKEIGALRKYLKVADTNVIKLENIDLDAAVLVEVASVADQAFLQANNIGLNKNQKVLIFGCGPIGLFCALKAKEENFNYLVVELNPYRIQIAKSLGLNIQSTGQALMDKENYMTFDFIFDCSGDGNKQSGFWKYFLHFSSVGVKALIVGKYINSPIINSSLMANRDALIKWMRGVPVEVLKDAQKIWQARLEINLKKFISHKFKSNQIKEAFEVAMLRDNTMKVVIEMEN